MRRDEQPRPPSDRSEFVTGWPVILVGLIGNGVSVQTLAAYTAGIFVAPLEQGFGWSRTSISLSVTILTFGTALASPVVGALVDRIGERILLASGICVIAACFFGFGAMGPSLLVFWSITATLAVFGSGCSPVPLSRLLLASFDRRLGTALGLSLVGVGLTAAIAPPIVGRIVEVYGWRAGYVAMGFVMLAALPLVLGLLSLHRAIDGTARQTARRSGPDLESAASPVGSVTPPSGRLLLAFFFVSLAVGGMVIHYVPMLIDAGMDPATAATMAGMIGIAVLVGRVGTGIILDRVSAPYVAAAMMGIGALGFLAVGLFGGMLTVLTAPIVGLSLGSELDLVAFMTSRYYSRPDFGPVFGRLYAVFLCGLGLSPLIDAQIFEHSGSYRLALLWTAFLLAVSAALFTRLPKLSGAG
jgi:MFS family permease